MKVRVLILLLIVALLIFAARHGASASTAVQGGITDAADSADASYTSDIGLGAEDDTGAGLDSGGPQFYPHPNDIDDEASNPQQDVGADDPNASEAA